MDAWWLIGKAGVRPGELGRRPGAGGTGTRSWRPQRGAWLSSVRPHVVEAVVRAHVRVRARLTARPDECRPQRSSRWHLAAPTCASWNWPCGGSAASGGAELSILGVAGFLFDCYNLVRDPPAAGLAPRSSRLRARPSPTMTEKPEPQSRDLPESVRRIVDEIENEIGDDDTAGFAPAPEPAAGLNGGIGAAVRQILLEIGVRIRHGRA